MATSRISGAAAMRAKPAVSILLLFLLWLGAGLAVSPLSATPALAAPDDPAQALGLGPHITVIPASNADVDPLDYAERYSALQIFTADAAPDEATTLANVNWGASVEPVTLLKAVAASTLSIGAYNDSFDGGDPETTAAVKEAAGGETTLGGLFKRWCKERLSKDLSDEGNYAKISARELGEFLSTFGQVGDGSTLGSSANTPYRSASPYSASRVAAAFAAVAETSPGKTESWPSAALYNDDRYKSAQEAGADGQAQGSAWVIPAKDKTLAPGYYLVIDSFKKTAQGNAVDAVAEPMLLAVGQAGTALNGKADAAAVAKRMYHSETDQSGDGVSYDSVSTGDKVLFRLKATLPTNVLAYRDRLDGSQSGYKLTFKDKLGAALTVDKSTVKVYVGTASTVPPDATRVYVDPETVTLADRLLTVPLPNLFELCEADGSGAKKSPAQKVEIRDASGGADQRSFVYVTYEAAIAKDAAQHCGTEAFDGLSNAASLEYSNDPNGPTTGTSDQTPDKVQLYTYGLDVKKVGDNGATPLEGAGFSLYAATGGSVPQEAGDGAQIALFARESDGTEAPASYRFVQWHAPVNDGGHLALKVDSGYAPTASDDDGTLYQICATAGAAQQCKVELRGLDEGAYTLRETQTPAGYDTAPAYTFAYDATEDAGTATLKLTEAAAMGANQAVTVSGVAEGVVASGIATLTVRNVAGLILPLTGGAGAASLIVGGACLVGAAAVGIYRARKRRARL